MLNMPWEWTVKVWKIAIQNARGDHKTRPTRRPREWWKDTVIAREDCQDLGISLISAWCVEVCYDNAQTIYKSGQVQVSGPRLPMDWQPGCGVMHLQSWYPLTRQELWTPSNQLNTPRKEGTSLTMLIQVLSDDYVFLLISMGRLDQENKGTKIQGQGNSWLERTGIWKKINTPHPPHPGPSLLPLMPCHWYR